MEYDVFEIRKYSVKIPSKHREQIKSGICFDRDSDPETIKRFSSFEEAKDEILNNQSKYMPSCVYRPRAVPFYSVEEYSIDCITMDEDDNFIDSEFVDYFVEFEFDEEVNGIVFF